MSIQDPSAVYNIVTIGFISSGLKSLADCPLQESENAPAAFLEVYPKYIKGIKDLQPGNKLCILTWLHLADRTVLQCHMRNMVGSKEYGVFSTRSPDRPNPVGLHIVTVMEIINPQKLKIFPMEALDGTPLIDIKPVI